MSNNIIHVSFTGPNRGKILANDKLPKRRYGVLLVRKSDRAIGVGQVITDIDIEKWCEEQEYDLVKSFRFNKEPCSDEKTRLAFSNR